MNEPIFCIRGARALRRRLFPSSFRVRLFGVRRRRAIPRGPSSTPTGAPHAVEAREHPTRPARSDRPSAPPPVRDRDRPARVPRYPREKRTREMTTTSGALADIQARLRPPSARAPPNVKI